MTKSIGVFTKSHGPLVAEQEPLVELHLNLWRSLGVNLPDLLDLGLRVANPRSIGGLRVYLPFAITPDQYEDLFPRIRSKHTASHVFNEQCTVQKADNEHAHLSQTKRILLTLISGSMDRGITVTSSARVDDADLGDGVEGSVIDIPGNLFRDEAVIGDAYIRFRIRLEPANTEMLFSTENLPLSKLVSALAETSDMLDLRVNHPRSFGPSLLTDFSDEEYELAKFSSVYFFYVRRITARLLGSHQPFSKMRRLEERVWGRYVGLAEGVPFTDYLIYQWKKLSEQKGKPVEDFLAVVLFQEGDPKMMTFLFLAVLIGALSSAISGLSVDLATAITGPAPKVISTIASALVSCAFWFALLCGSWHFFLSDRRKG